MDAVLGDAGEGDVDTIGVVRGEVYMREGGLEVEWKMGMVDVQAENYDKG